MYSNSKNSKESPKDLHISPPLQPLPSQSVSLPSLQLPPVLGTLPHSTIIIAMTTTPLPFPPGMSLRSTRILPAPPPPLPSLLPTESAPTADSHLTPNHGPLHEQDELPGRAERESTSLLQAENSKERERERERPLTRSRANSIGITAAVLGSCETPPVALERMMHKKEEQSSSKKEKQTLTVMQTLTVITPTQPQPITKEAILPPIHKETTPPPVPTLPTPKRVHSKPPPPPPPPSETPQHIPTTNPPLTPTPAPSSFLTLYGDYRKSYRKTTKTEILSFPYRKHHDPLQGRITAVLNKLAAQRQCRKELESLADRTAKAGGREGRNKFVVGGLRMVVRMARERQKTGGMVDGRVLSRLGTEIKTLQGRILEQLQDFSQYLPPQHKPDQKKDPRASSYRSLVIKKLYSVLKHSQQTNKAQLRERVVNQCQGFFRGEVSMDEMVRFVRSRLEGQE